MKKLFLFLLFLSSVASFSQSTLIQPGGIIPTMTTLQRTAIEAPTNGMLVYDSWTQSYWYRKTGAWIELTNYWTLSGALGNEIKNTNTGGFWSANPTAVTGGSPTTAPPASGGGTRLMWMPAMSAFRAGTVDFTQWDNGNIGKWSTAFGRNNKASGAYSFASGVNVSANNNLSVVFGVNSTVSCDTCMAIGNNITLSGNSTVAIGSNIDGVGSKSFILGNDIHTSAGNAFVAKFKGGYYFHTGTGGYGGGEGGVTLSSGANSWASISDSTKKENFISANGEDVLMSVSKMRVGTWNYKGQNPQTFRHWGVMAQEFYKYFGTDKYGTVGNDKSIATADFDGVVFSAVKALEARTRKTNDDMAIMRKEMERLEEMIEELRDEIDTKNKTKDI